MPLFDSGSPEDARDLVAASDHVEILSPIAEALGALADLIRTVPVGLSGASIAQSDRGTLLLNMRAWELFGDALCQRIPRLLVSVPARDSAKPIKFFLSLSTE